MKTAGFFLTALLCLFLNIDAKAQLFTQDFSSSTATADYVSATPNNGQFNSILTSGAGTTVAISGGALQYTRTGNAGSFSRTTDFSPTPTSLSYQLDISVSGNNAATTSAAIFYVGSGFSTNNSNESNANSYARFAVNFTSTPGSFSIRDITNGNDSAVFAGTQRITWELNNSGASINYTAPDGTTQTVANDTADLYIGTTLAFNDVAVQTPAQVMTDIKFVFNNGSGIIALDNFLINPVSAPSAAGATINGRITDANGRGLKHVVVMMTGDGLEDTIYATTSAFGYYHFEDVPAGNTYILTPFSRTYSFDQPSVVINVNGDFAGADFVGESRFTRVGSPIPLTKLK